jgi:hypothetical protein
LPERQEFKSLVRRYGLLRSASFLLSSFASLLEVSQHKLGLEPLGLPVFMAGCGDSVAEHISISYSLFVADQVLRPKFQNAWKFCQPLRS